MDPATVNALIAGVAVVLAMAAAAVKWRVWLPFRELAVTLFRMLCCRGRRRRGELSGLVFPTSPDEIDAETLTELLRHGGHLPDGVAVTSVRRSGAAITDGVKGDKAVLEVSYGRAAGPPGEAGGGAESACDGAADGAADGASDAMPGGDAKVEVPVHLDLPLPKRFFVKFSLQGLSAMRLLMETTKVVRCEALFYHRLAPKVAGVLRTPKCYFCDYSETTGEFILLSELVEFGKNGIRPLKHRIRDKNVLEEQLLFIRSGARLNAAMWHGKLGGVLDTMPRFDETHREMWLVAQLMARFGGLGYTAQRTLRGRKVNEAFMTWDVPNRLRGRESELISDMPRIMEHLCMDKEMLAFGHNDYTTDNAFFWTESNELKFGVFDWQQSCVNNVGQEWAWNLHFLEPEFLTKHEDSFVDLILSTYEANGRNIRREDFLRAYALGTIQMFVWGGSGLQFLLANLHGKGVFETMVPNDPRCRESKGTGLSEEVRKKMIGAEMTRRTFTNCCNIMRRHNFYDAWQEWKNPTSERSR